MKLWKKVEIVENPPVFITAEDECYYARDYIARGSFKDSEANQLISNLKKHPKYRGTASWRYKEQAIERFARELAAALAQKVSVAAIPTSKLPKDPEYDPRLAECLKRLGELRPDLVIEKPFTCRASTVPSHHGGTRRIDELQANLDWHGLSPDCRTVILIDDVLTTGAHFKACKRLIAQEAPGIRVAGVF